MSATDTIPAIRDGHCFHRPGPLPRGRHPLARGHVIRAQSERLMIAVTELGAAHDYRSIGVREITSHARVSRVAFYECFTGKDACVYAAYDRFITLLVDRVVAATRQHDTWEKTVAALVSAYLATLDEDPVVARAFQVEMDALGRQARDRRRDALTGVAQLLKDCRDQQWPGTDPLALSAYVAAVYAMRQLACDLLDDSSAPDLAALAVELGPAVASLLG